MCHVFGGLKSGTSRRWQAAKEKKICCNKICAMHMHKLRLKRYLKSKVQQQQQPEQEEEEQPRSSHETSLTYMSTIDFLIKY